jgi:hypothetical protein
MPLNCLRKPHATPTLWTLIKRVPPPHAPSSLSSQMPNEPPLSPIKGVSDVEPQLPGIRPTIALSGREPLVSEPQKPNLWKIPSLPNLPCHELPLPLNAPIHPLSQQPSRTLPANTNLQNLRPTPLNNVFKLQEPKFTISLPPSLRLITSPL